jgi:Asp-tRNA(Asn)/Glu-tRNA(Gln) amidotransferase A subunit family amidase
VGGDPGKIGLIGEANFSRRPKPERFAVLETGGWSATNANARAAFAAAKQRLAGMGVTLHARGDDPLIEAAERAMADALTITRQINEWEGRWPLNAYAEIDASKLSGSAQERLHNANKLSQRDYAELVGRRDVARAAFAKAAENYDAFITLGATGAAPVGFATTGNPVMNVAASLLGVPALTLPVLEDEKLPLGLQLMGAVDCDAALFETATWVAAALERADLIGSPE